MQKRRSGFFGSATRSRRRSPRPERSTSRHEIAPAGGAGLRHGAIDAVVVHGDRCLLLWVEASFPRSSETSRHRDAAVFSFAGQRHRGTGFDSREKTHGGFSDDCALTDAAGPADGSDL